MLVYGECEYFVMQMLYVCVLCASCGSSQCCILHDLQFVKTLSTHQSYCQNVMWESLKWIGGVMIKTKYGYTITDLILPNSTQN